VPPEEAGSQTEWGEEAGWVSGRSFDDGYRKICKEDIPLYWMERAGVGWVDSFPNRWGIVQTPSDTP
jgi:hypothetical protein